MTSVTRQLAETLTATTAADLPETVRQDTRRAILDWLGSALAGAAETPARLTRRVVSRLGASDEATVFGGGRASAAVAALANGVSSHILELDDIHRGSTVHGAAPIIPAALAVAEREHADGIAFIRAVTLGYEAALRIGEAVNPSHYRYWHPTGTAATFGAAAAAGSLLDFTADEMVQALGSAGTQAAGLWEFNADGAMSKHLHPGKAAFNGVLSADLSRAGFTGASRILEGERGFFQAMSQAHDSSRITDGLGSTWKVSENGFKLHACCGHTHSAIDLAIAARKAQTWGTAEVLARVANVLVETYGPGYDIVKQAAPTTPYQAKFSLAYCVAAGLLEGRVALEQFAPGRLGSAGVRDSSLAALLQRTQVAVADDLTNRYPAAWPARLTLTLTDGSVLQSASDYPRGNPENPVSTGELEDKFMTLLSSRIGRETADVALRAVQNLERCEDMAATFSGLHLLPV